MHLLSLHLKTPTVVLFLRIANWEFTRKFRLVEMFSNEEEETTQENDGNSIVKQKSTFKPPRNRNLNLDNTVNFLQKQKLKKQQPYYNQTLENQKQ